MGIVENIKPKMKYLNRILVKKSLSILYRIMSWMTFLCFSFQQTAASYIPTVGISAMFSIALSGEMHMLEYLYDYIISFL